MLDSHLKPTSISNDAMPRQILIMPSRKKKSKAKGRKPAAGKGGADKVAENASAVDQQKKGTPLDSEMQRLRIGDKQSEEDALLEEAIKLAAVEEQEIKTKEKENCTHGYNPSSTFQARYCEDFMKKFTESYHSAITLLGDNSLYARGYSVTDAFKIACSSFSSLIGTTNALRYRSNAEHVNPFCLAEGTKIILDGKSDDARLPALLALITDVKMSDSGPQKMMELLAGDEHTLVQFFRKQIPCSCLDEKYKEVKSITKMGICFNGDCPLPDRMATRSSMLCCTGCRMVNYCSKECQEADWPVHKEFCGLTAEELGEMYFNEHTHTRDGVRDNITLKT